MKFKLHITPAPIKKNSILNHLLSGVENSSTITSDQAMYVKVPAVSEKKMMLVSSDEPENIIPIETPKGVAKAKINSKI